MTFLIELHARYSHLQGVDPFLPIPSLTIDGVLPPFTGAEPGGPAHDMSPYSCSALEFCLTFGSTPDRQDILRGWLEHRSRLRGIGWARGFQWIDGSFTEAKPPQDLDTVLFLHRPSAIANDRPALNALAQANMDLFARDRAKQAFRLDLFFVDLDGSPETIVNLSRYYLGLFSHRRIDFLWKGMVQIRLDTPSDDAAALQALGGGKTAAPSAGAST